MSNLPDLSINQQAVEALAALAQATRLATFRQLVAAGPSGLAASALADVLGVPANTLSFHLKALLHVGLITQERQGRSLIYRANYVQMNGLIAYLTENCCEGNACDVVQHCGC